MERTMSKQAKSVIEQFARLENAILAKGGRIPKPWPWADQDPVIRNLQLLEELEALEAGTKPPTPMPYFK
jgi:hypothetical protein